MSKVHISKYTGYVKSRYFRQRADEDGCVEYDPDTVSRIRATIDRISIEGIRNNTANSWGAREALRMLTLETIPEDCTSMDFNIAWADYLLDREAGRLV